MKKYKFVFLILNYNVVKETIECIMSIINNIVSEDYGIVIVDNGSKECVYKDLELYLKNLEKTNIFLMRNDVNEGFAKGNNKGFIFAKNILHAEYILQINNDTVLEQSDLLILLESAYKKTQAYVIGPDIFAPKQNSYQNPQPTISYLKRDIVKCMINSLLHIIAIKLNIEDAIINNHYVKKKDISNINSHICEQMKNVTLHGSALFFTPKYVQEFDGMYDKTFLYREENILYYLMKNKGYSMVFCPELKITHLEDVSTESVASNNREKRMFCYLNLLKSDFIMLKLITSKEK